MQRLSRVAGAGLVALALSAQALVAPAGLIGSDAVRAEPPPWAPAHGYRAKHGHKHGYEHGHGHKHRGDERTVYAERERTFGILDGRCNRELLGQVLGGAVGAAAGSQVGSGSGRTAAIIGGAVLGTLIGGRIGRHMDDLDRHCVGQTLERAETGQSVRWENPDRGGGYTVTPRRTYQRDDGRYCREYTTESRIGGETRTVYGTACRQPDGSWELAS